MKKASRSNQRDALIMIYSFNYGQYHLYFLISIPIHTVPKISTGLFYSQHAHTYSFRISTGLFYLQLTYTYGPRISTGLFYLQQTYTYGSKISTGLY